MAIDINQIKVALAAHTEWRTRLIDAINKGTSDFDVDLIKVDNLCYFGKWFYSLSQSEQNTDEARKVKELHAAFHKAAAQTLSLALLGKKMDAKRSIEIGGAYSQASGRLIFALDEWKKKI